MKVLRPKMDNNHCYAYAASQSSGPLSFTHVCTSVYALHLVSAQWIKSPLANHLHVYTRSGTIKGRLNSISISDSPIISILELCPSLLYLEAGASMSYGCFLQIFVFKVLMPIMDNNQCIREYKKGQSMLKTRLLHF